MVLLKRTTRRCVRSSRMSLVVARGEVILFRDGTHGFFLLKVSEASEW